MYGALLALARGFLKLAGIPSGWPGADRWVAQPVHLGSRLLPATQMDGRLSFEDSRIPTLGRCTQEPVYNVYYQVLSF